MKQTAVQERGQISESSLKPDTSPGLLSCYGMIFKWAKVRQNQVFTSIKIGNLDRKRPYEAVSRCINECPVATAALTYSNTLK